jgi:hypothetical protein
MSETGISCVKAMLRHGIPHVNRGTSISPSDLPTQARLAPAGTLAIIDIAMLAAYIRKAGRDFGHAHGQ